MKQPYKRSKKTVSFINYHFVFCPRYRRKIFVDEKVSQRFKEIVSEICNALDIEIISIDCDKDHAHLYLNALPHISPSNIMAKIKGESSSILRQEFSHLNRAVSLWTRSFFVSTAENVSSDTIKKYIEEQKMRG